MATVMVRGDTNHGGEDTNHGEGNMWLERKTVKWKTGRSIINPVAADTGHVVKACAV